MTEAKVDYVFGSKCANGSGTVSAGSGIRRVGVSCDGCGRFFAGERHPVETNLIESPRWEAHVRAARAANPNWKEG